MTLLKCCCIFLMIILLIRFRVPLWASVLAASAAAALLFQLPFPLFISRVWGTLSGRSCLELLLITYGLILLQQLMEEKQMLAAAEKSLSGLFHDPRRGSVASAIVSGLLPSPAAVLMAGSMLKKRYAGLLPDDTTAFVTTYFRHIPEALLPVYTNVILICAVTGTPEWKFLLLMLPYTILNVLVPYFIYLHPLKFSGIPSKADSSGNFRELLACVLRSLWPVLLIILLILCFRINTAVSVYLTLALFLIQQKFTSRQLLRFLKSAWNWNMMLMVAAILIFTDILGFAQVPDALLLAVSAVPVPLFLIYGFVMFAGSIVSNFTAMIPAVFPLIVSGSASSGALIIYLASLGHLASQLCPTHICISLCAEQFHISINDIFRRTIPVTAVMLAAATAIYLIMKTFPI